MIAVQPDRAGALRMRFSDMLYEQMSEMLTGSEIDHLAKLLADAAVDQLLGGES